MNKVKFLTTEELLAKTTQKLLDNGLDYNVKLGSNTTVELLDGMTGMVLATSTKETLEEAIMNALVTAVARPKSDMLSIM